MNTLIKTSIAIASFLLLQAGMAPAQQMTQENAEPEKITSGYQFTEGPVWHPSGYLLFSDIPANTIYKWTPGSDAETYLSPSGHSNGLTFDHQGRLVLVRHDGALTRYTKNKGIETLADSYNGKRLNSPNDLTIHSDGSIYFTDPPFGVSEEDKELKIHGVYRYSEAKGLQLLSDDFDLPNGIALSPDETQLYVNDSRHNHIRVFDIARDGKIENGRLFATMESDAQGSADGMKVDGDGNVYSTGPGGLWIFSPEGKLLQQVKTPRLTNLAWGGKDKKTLFMTAPEALYKLEMTTRGYIPYW
ncbi:MAG: SMP-30/gluconolactonase/LRE family protein [Bacteroidales bacterium]|nr:SMP-30/gluconolactonase/LRE family protein [Bacteroidales bacterium]